MDSNARQIIINLDNPNIDKWIEKIAKVQMNSAFGDFEGCEIFIMLGDKVLKESLLPVHLVSLACLVKQLQKSGCICGHIKGNDTLINYMKNDLHISDYFSSAIFYVEGESDYNLNLWRVSSEHSLMYSQYVSDYLKRRYFKEKDLSMLKVVLDELYANIADHSEAEGIAYSFINYDIKSGLIRIAFCDFGIGIKESLLKSGSKISNDFVRFATQKGVSAQSNTHNRGYGLDTVISAVCASGNSVRILSGKELLISYGSVLTQRTWLLDFDFMGTLIYFDIPVSSFEDSDYMYDFEL